MIYLDNAATTYPKSEKVYQAMDWANRNLSVNAGRGSYSLAQKASAIMTETKALLRKLVSAEASASVVFTPSITIALNEIIGGIEWNANDVVYVSPYEHNAVARTLYLAEKRNNIKVKQIPIDENSLEIDIERMKYEFSKEKPRAVFCIHVSNVTGYILPVKEIFNEAKKYDAYTVLDSAQSLGLININVRELPVDIIAFAGHKTLYGPFGIGGFINISNVSLLEYLAGGTGSDSLNLDMPEGRESKYEFASMNIVAIEGLRAALKELNQEEIYKKEKVLTDYLVEKLKEIKGIKLYLPGDLSKHISIVSFTVQGMDSDDVGTILDEDFDIAVRTGYHCAPWIHEYLKDKSSVGTVRVGLGCSNTTEDIDELLKAIYDII